MASTIPQIEVELLNRQSDLLERIRKGNDVLFDAFERVSPAKWKERQQFLFSLEQELKALGWDDCAYEPHLNPPKHICIACTFRNETWSRDKCPAWGKFD